MDNDIIKNLDGKPLLNKRQFKHFMFDLDNTLYPESSSMDNGITQRMNGTVAEYLKISYDEALELRHKNLPKYSSTLEWLRACYGLTDVDWFFSSVHPESELSELVFDERLRPFLQSLEMPMSVLTNAPMEHAVRVLRFFNIEDLFIDICDIKKNNFQGKPYKCSYNQAVKMAGFSIDDTLFFDDHPKYIRGYEAIGGNAVLIDEKHKYPNETCNRMESVFDIPSLFEK